MFWLYLHQFQPPHHERIHRGVSFRSICIVFNILLLCQISDQAPTNQDQLHLVQVIWRDGDHVPARICKKDANHWPGQQWGQLTVTGMQQHQALGALLFEKYAIQAKLLNTTYSSSELHIRTVDLNRTITSATSNALGMFYDDSNLVAGLDYPNNNDWPKGYLPIPVHMIEQQTDHLLSLDSECARRRYLINDVLHKSKQFTETEQKAQAFLDELSKICGEKVTLTDVPFLMNSYRIERSQGRIPLLSPEQYQRLQPIENLLNNYMNGKGVQAIQGIELNVELPKVRAGGLLWQILNRMDAKVKCLNSATDKKTKECKYLDTLKYYAYSVAGNMFDAFMATAHLETPSAQNRTSDASAILFEFWTTAEGVNAIKVFYVDCPTSDFKSLNPQICNGTAKDFCVLDEFKKKMQPYNPGDIDALCSQVPSSYQNTKSQSVRASEQEIQSWTIDKQQEELNSTAADAAGRKRELIFVHAAWRHGDRTPKSICPNDRDNQASTWRKGHGDTTVLGMQEQQQLGALIYNEFAVKNKFLSATYNSAEMYVRAVDLNRTLTSAQSNLLGMYYNRPNQDNLYPHEAAWPKGYFPIPIHTVNMATDYVSDPHAMCARKNDLLALQWKTEKVTEFVKNNQEFLKEVSNVCGAPLTIKNISVAVDTMFVELQHNRTPIFNQKQYEHMIRIDSFMNDFFDGLLNSVNETFHGYNLRVDLATIAGGNLLWDMIHRMQEKIKCSQLTNINKTECAWIRDLKYYAYSTRGSTLNGLLAALDAAEVYRQDEVRFGSAIIVELWRNENAQYEIIVRFREKSFGSELRNVTKLVGVCGRKVPCSWNDFVAGSETYNPGDFQKYCAKRISPINSITTPVSTTTTTPMSTTTTSGTSSKSFSLLSLVSATKFVGAIVTKLLGSYLF